jgi:alanyl-tRNA synthetase
VPAAVQRAIAERDLHFKNVRSLLQRVAETDALAVLQSAKPGENGLRIIARTFDESSQPEYLNHFATQLAKADKTIAFLGRSACGHLIFAQHASAGLDMNALLKQVFAQFAGKGGGTRDFARGRLNDATQVESAVAFARELTASR